MVKKLFIEIRLCNLTTYVFKGHVKIVKIWYSLKSGPKTRDLGPWDLRPQDSETQDHGTPRPGIRRPWDPRFWITRPWLSGPWNWDPDTQDPGNGSLGLGNCDPEAQNPESRTLRIELATEIPSIPTRTTDWINFNLKQILIIKSWGIWVKKLDARVNRPKHLPKYSYMYICVYAHKFSHYFIFPSITFVIVR